MGAPSPDRRCLVQIPNPPRHHTERSRVRDDYDEQTAFDSYMNPEASFTMARLSRGPKQLRVFVPCLV